MNPTSRLPLGLQTMRLNSLGIQNVTPQTMATSSLMKGLLGVLVYLVAANSLSPTGDAGTSYPSLNSPAALLKNRYTTLIHPSSSSLPNQVCEQALLNLENTYWIPLHLSNEWYVATKAEIFTVLCGSMKFQLTLQNRRKLYLPPRCKGYSTHSTLYALSTLVQNNSQEDVLPLAPVDLDCCLNEYEREQLHKIPLQKPLTNILSSVEDLNLASVKLKSES
jgi:hypothetical protein